MSLQRLRDEAHALKRNVHALIIAARDPRVPWYAKMLAAAIVAYAVSPIDLIPDFIPVLGYVDELIILPFGIRAVIRLIPPDVWVELQQRADGNSMGRGGRVVAAVIIAMWLTVVVWSGLYARSRWLR